MRTSARSRTEDRRAPYLHAGMEAALADHHELELPGHHWKMGLTAPVGGSPDATPSPRAAAGALRYHAASWTRPIRQAFGQQVGDRSAETPKRRNEQRGVRL